MLVDYEYKAGRLITSYIGADGNLKVKHFNWRNPMKYQLTDQHDPMAHSKYKSWDGRKVKLAPTNKPDRYSIYEYLDAIPKDEQDEIFNYAEPNIFFCDIETEIVDTGFVEPTEATSKVLSIAVVHKRKVIVLGLKPLHRNEEYWICDEINKRFKKLGASDFSVDFVDFSLSDNAERDMLDYFFSKLVPRMPVLTGWNFVNYDWTFLVNRSRRLGVDYLQASITNRFTGNATPVQGTGFRGDNSELPFHRVIVDYMDLYKKWDTSIKIKESNSLDFVAEKTLGGEGKVVYSGGLQTLYDQDYKNYLFYNVVDTILVQMIHEKMKYINVMYATAALSKTRILDSLSALRVTEGIMRNDLRSMKDIVLCRDYEADDVDGRVEGGYVLDPAIRGLNKWLVCYDFASLYPTTQRQNNIAPENFKGVKIPGQMKADFNGRKVDILPEDVVTIAYGEEGRLQQQAVFSKDFSVTCNKLSEIYNDRKKFKKKMLQAKDELKHLEKELEELL